VDGLDAQTFSEIPVNIEGVMTASVAWGDYDNDGDLDLAVIGDTSLALGKYCSRIYRNDNGEFAAISTSLINVGSGSVTWGDYDNDGDLDILLMGSRNDVAGVMKVYKNTAGIFTDSGISLRSLERGTANWGDYDQDGDLDILGCGASLPQGIFTMVYSNNRLTSFSALAGGLPGNFLGNCGWVDYDNDGDLDVFITGENESGYAATELFRNNETTFDSVANTLPDLRDSFGIWDDVDNDEDMDLFISGYNQNMQQVYGIYLNTNGLFSMLNVNWGQSLVGRASWGDVNDDNLSDLVIGGLSASRIYINTGTSFYQLNTSPLNMSAGLVIFGDYDGDGDLDLFIVNSVTAKLYRNDLSNIKPNPAPPINLAAISNNGDVEFSWEAPAGSDTSGSVYSYNVYVGTHPQGIYIVSPMSNLTTGKRLLPQVGNAGYKKGFKLVNLPEGTYYWSVQSIDRSYKSSTFAPEQMFTVFYDSVNHPPQAVHDITNQALVLGRDTFTRNLMTEPVIFADPDKDVLNFSIWAADTSVVRVLVEGTSITIIPQIRGETVVTVTANDNRGGSTETSFTTWILILDQQVPFVPVEQQFEGLFEGGAEWVDYDTDGDLDLIYYGHNDYVAEPQTRILKNNQGVFSAVDTLLPPLALGTINSGDYDNDGDLDILMSGYTSFSPISFIRGVYKNDDGIFVPADTVLADLAGCVSDWGDYDNDGDLDILLTGFVQNEGGITKIYRNDSTNFVDIFAPLIGVIDGSVAWGDYDNDGDLDVLLSGYSTEGNVTRIYRNDNGEFTDTYMPLVGVTYSSATFGDYDDDGDLDILVSGLTDEGAITKIYRNDKGAYYDIQANLPMERSSTVKWGDYDNDGDLDVILTAYNEVDTTWVSKIYNNYNGCLVDIGIDLPDVDCSSIAWGDYDNDGDLDFFLSGIDYKSGAVAYLYRNDADNQNKPPQYPQNLKTRWIGQDVVFSWDKATDDETKQDGLTYNIRVGTGSEMQNVVSPMADIYTGKLLKPQFGNMDKNNSWVLKNIKAEKVYWSVQTVDNGFCGSGFAPEQYSDPTSLQAYQTTNFNFKLYQNYPNPFNPITTISYSIKYPVKVELCIYDIMGQKIITLVNQIQTEGKYSIQWDCSTWASGIYFYKLKTSIFEQSRKMLLLR